MKKNRKALLMEAMYRHGNRVLAIYPECREKDPVKLCSKLKRIEDAAFGASLDLCNTPNSETRSKATIKRCLVEATELLGAGPPVCINTDPRGCALKIDAEYARDLAIHRDMGGDGILSPDLTPGDDD